MEQNNSGSQLAYPALTVLQFPQTAAEKGLRGRMAQQSADVIASPLERLMDYVYFASLWFSLPLAIWLNSSRIGLTLHWQACQMRPAWWRKVLMGKSRVFPGLK